MAMQENVATNATGWKRFLRDVRGELKKVSWPTRKELMTHTVVVFVAVLLVALLIWGMDTLFSYLFRLILKS